MAPFVVVLPPETTIAEPRTEQAKPPEAEVEANPNPEPSLKYKTWILKVSIHCEGCKRKVKRILSTIDGVYETDIDLKQQKVTVIGNVEAETLIKVLGKTWKHAELWPEDPKSKKKGKSSKQEKDKQKEAGKESDTENSEAGESDGDCTGEKLQQVKETTIGKPKEVKIDLKPTVITVEACNPVGEAGDGGSAVNKKKKKKGGKASTAIDTGGDTEQQRSDDPAAAIQTPPPNGIPNGSSFPARPLVFQLPQLYSEPVYTVNSNTVPFPGPNRGMTCYYFPPYGSNRSGETPPSSDSFHIMSDENPNACKII